MPGRSARGSLLFPGVRPAAVPCPPGRGRVGLPLNGGGDTPPPLPEKPQRGKRRPAVSRSPGRGAGPSALRPLPALDRESVREWGRRHTHPQRALDGSWALRGAAAWGRAGAQGGRRWPRPRAEAADGGHRWRRGRTGPDSLAGLRSDVPAGCGRVCARGSAGARSGGNRRRARVSRSAERHRGDRAGSHRPGGILHGRRNCVTPNNRISALLRCVNYK